MGTEAVAKFFCRKRAAGTAVEIFAGGGFRAGDGSFLNGDGLKVGGGSFLNGDGLKMGGGSALTGDGLRPADESSPVGNNSGQDETER